MSAKSGDTRTACYGNKYWYSRGDVGGVKPILPLLYILCFVTTAVWESIIEGLRSKVNAALISLTNYCERDIFYA